jgi:two-component sensor histidine kinase
MCYPEQLSCLAGHSIALVDQKREGAVNMGRSVPGLAPDSRFDYRHWWRRAPSPNQVEQGYDADPVYALREALAREAILIRQQGSFADEQEALRNESDHRLLNGLQMVVSLLMLQSRAAVTSEVAQQLSIAANRVATIERIHRRLHLHDGTHSVAFREYLEEFCSDFSGIMASDEVSEQTIMVQCAEVSIPTATAIPLGFIVNELITNAVKYGKGRIGVRLEGQPSKGCTLTVSNDGPALPEGFDPAASKGIGMKIIQSFVRQIGGRLTFGRGDANQGAQFTVHFSCITD